MSQDLSQLNESELLAAAGGGNDEALGLLLFRQRPALLAAIRPQLGAKIKQTSSEEDILQETYRREDRIHRYR